jgi:hypothetical protein
LEPLYNSRAVILHISSSNFFLMILHHPYVQFSSIVLDYQYMICYGLSLIVGQSADIRADNCKK